MLFLIIAGLIAFLFGVTLLTCPNTLRLISEYANKALVTFEETVYNLRVGIGVSSILASILLFFTAYYLMKVHG